MTTLKITFTVVAAVGAVVACGGGGGSTGSGSTSSADSFVGEYCDLYAPCCAKVSKTYNQQKCKTVFAALLGNSTYDPGAGQGCLDNARVEASNPTFCESGLSDEGDNKCDKVFKQAPSNGTKKPGETCDDDSECASSAEGEGNCASSFSSTQTIRACQIQTHGKEGEDCAGEKDEENNSSTTIGSGSSSSGGGDAGAPSPPQKVAICFIGDGLFCETTFTSGSSSGGGSTSTQKCAKTQPIDGPCQSSNEHACVKGARCDTTAKKCVARKPTGEACGSSFSGSDECAEKNFCDSTTKKCAPTIARGQPCTKSEECEDRSCTNGKCGFGGSTSSTTNLICQ